MQNSFCRFFLVILGLLLLTTGQKLTAQSFHPDQYLGTWEGSLVIAQKGKVADSIQIELLIAPLPEKDSWTWRTEYFSPTYPMVKDYILRKKEGDIPIFVVDEGDGIELQEYSFGSKLYSVFETQGVLLTSTYEFRKNAIIFEVTAGKNINSDDTRVRNFSVDSVQRALLHKKQ